MSPIFQRLRQTYAIIKRVITSKITLSLAALIFIALLVTPLITYGYYAADIKDRDRLMNKTSTGIILRDKNGEIFYQYGKINGDSEAKLDQISDYLEQALVASEDAEFYKHEGYSLKGIVRALYANVANQDLTRYGGSTITQQLVKNKLLTVDKNYFRKYQEFTMAIAVERYYTKAEIMEMYLNSVYFGEGAFGINDAAKVYFNKTPQELDLAESSMLVGLLPAPSAYSPIGSDGAKAKQRQEKVLSHMVETGYITATAKDHALSQNLTYVGYKSTNYQYASHYTTMVLDELKRIYGEEKMNRSGFDVTTALDLNWQKHAETKLSEKIQTIKDAGARNGSLVAIDPKTGEVRALVGSVDWNEPKFGKVNMATSPRQPGSSFKPIYYTEALEKKIITAATVLEDKPKNWDTYAPQNYDNKFRGNIPVRHALAQSLNVPSVEVMHRLGTAKASAAAQEMGLSTVNEPDKYGLSLALGTAEVKLLELTNAYAAFANLGKQHKATLVTSIKDKYDDSVYKSKTNNDKQVVAPEASYLISSILSDNNARAPTFGSSLNIENKQVAVKTGTTNDSKDAWTLGYKPNLVVGTWVGNNEHEPMNGLSGSRTAGVIWKETMSEYLKNMPDENFVQPTNIISMLLCQGIIKNAASYFASTHQELFIAGTEPKDECNQTKQEEKKNKKEEEQKPEEKKPNENSGEGNGNGGNDSRDEDEGGRGGGGSTDAGTTTGDPTTEPTDPPTEEPDPTPTPT